MLFDAIVLCACTVCIQIHSISDNHIIECKGWMDWKEKDIGDWMMRYRQWNESEHDFVIVSILFFWLFLSLFVKFPLNAMESHRRWVYGTKWKTIKNRLTIISHRERVTQWISMNEFFLRSSDGSFFCFTFFRLFLDDILISRTLLTHEYRLNKEMKQKNEEAKKKYYLLLHFCLFVLADRSGWWLTLHKNIRKKINWKWVSIRNIHKKRDENDFA